MERPGPRIPKRWIAGVLVLLVVMASERWDGPFTFEAIGQGTASIAEAASDRLSGPDDAGVVYLTFDDGPHLVYTPQILDVLAKHDAKVVFFPIGNQVAGGASVLRRAVDEGHRIGNHTWNHDSLQGITDAEFDRVVGRTEDAIVAATGATPECLRPPGGVIDDSARSTIRASGMSVMLWTVDPGDWDQPGRSEIVAGVLDQVGDRDIVLLHDGGGDRSQTVEALDDILDELSRRGYRFEAIPRC